jgi:hypothetical protein
MNVAGAVRRRTRVDLPSYVVPPFEVYVNGIEQRPGVDFEADGRVLWFARELKTEGRLGFWRWLSLWVGVAGTYRQDDSVDVVYATPSGKAVAAKLPLVAGEPGPGGDYG